MRYSRGYLGRTLCSQRAPFCVGRPQRSPSQPARPGLYDPPTARPFYRDGRASLESNQDRKGTKTGCLFVPVLLRTVIPGMLARIIEAKARGSTRVQPEKPAALEKRSCRFVATSRAHLTTTMIRCAPRVRLAMYARDSLRSLRGCSPGPAQQTSLGGCQSCPQEP